MFSTVTCQPKRRRIAWPRAIREKIAAAIKEKILGVMPTSTIEELRVCAFSLKCAAQTKASGSGQAALHCLRPLLWYLCSGGDIVSPGEGQVGWRPNEKDEAFSRTASLDLLIEFERLSGKMSAHVEQYELVQIGLPQKSRRVEAVGSMDLDATTRQDTSSHVAGRLVTVNEENFLAINIRTIWRLRNHSAPPVWRPQVPIECRLPGLSQTLRARRSPSSSFLRPSDSP